LWNVQVKGATLTWDAAAGDGIVITDGPGIWTNGLGNWNNAGTDVNWNNATLDDAVFGGGTLGAAGIVTLGGPITAATLTFNLPNGGGAYTIAGGGANILTLNTGITANSAANILCSHHPRWREHLVEHFDGLAQHQRQHHQWS